MIDEYDALDYFNAKEEEKPLDFVFEGETIEDIDYEVKKYLAKISSVDDTMRLFEIANERKNFISKKEIKKEEKSPTINPNIKMTNIKIIGVGGGGCNAVSYMATKRKIRNVDFYLANTDMQALTRYDDPHLNKIHLGINETKGLGAGSDPEVGKRATLESLDSINKVLDGADLVFIAAGMGGGTGTGGAPLIAKAAKDRGCLTIGIVTSPFVLEGERRRVQALQGINEIRGYVDSLIIVANETLNNIRGSVSFKRAFEESNEVLAQSVYAITSILTENSLMNVDFADVRYTLKNKGNALIGFGTGKGNNRAIEAVEAAISSPLVGSSIIGAKNAIVCITGTDKVSLEQINDVIDKIKEAAQGQLDIILGLNDEMNANNLYDSNAEIIVTVVATDFAVRSDEKVEEIQDYKKRIDDLRRIQFFQEESNEASSTSSEDDDSIPSYLKRNI